MHNKGVSKMYQVVNISISRELLQQFLLDYRVREAVPVIGSGKSPEVYYNSSIIHLL